MMRATLSLALFCASPAFARPCNDTFGCVVRALMCKHSVRKPERCHYEHLHPERGLGLCTFIMQFVATRWVVGDRNSREPPHPGFMWKEVSCVTPDDADL